MQPTDNVVYDDETNEDVSNKYNNIASRAPNNIFSNQVKEPIMECITSTFTIDDSELLMSNKLHLNNL